jgi:hypothetical protein
MRVVHNHFEARPVPKKKKKDSNIGTMVTVNEREGWRIRAFDS